MCSATVRRFALLAAIMLLGTVAWRADVAAGVVENRGRDLARLASPDLAPVPAVRRLVSRAVALVGPRADHRTGFLVVAVAGLLLLLRKGLTATSAGPAPKSRLRGQRIALRAPPALSCP